MEGGIFHHYTGKVIIFLSIYYLLASMDADIYTKSYTDPLRNILAIAGIANWTLVADIGFINKKKKKYLLSLIYCNFQTNECILVKMVYFAFYAFCQRFSWLMYPAKRRASFESIRQPVCGIYPLVRSVSLVNYAALAETNDN